MRWKTAASTLLLGFFLASASLAQDRTCSDLSRGNPTLYRQDGGTMRCLDWNQATCSYVERPCHLGELGALCYYIPMTCSLIGPPSSRTVVLPESRRKSPSSRFER